MSTSIGPTAFGPFPSPPAPPGNSQPEAAAPSTTQDSIVPSHPVPLDLSTALLLGGAGSIGAVEGSAALSGPPGWAVGGARAAGAAGSAGIHNVEQWQAGEAEYRKLRTQAHHEPLTAADSERLAALRGIYDAHPTPMAGTAPHGPSLTTTPVERHSGSTTTTPIQADRGSTTTTPIDAPRGTALTTPIHQRDHAPHTSPISHTPTTTDQALFARSARDVHAYVQPSTIEKVTWTKVDPAKGSAVEKEFYAKARPAFLKNCVQNHEAELRAAGIDDAGIARMRNGTTPDNYDVHHIQPKDLGGTNDLSNLQLMRKDEHRMLSGLQKSVTNGMRPGESRTFDFVLTPKDALVIPTKAATNLMEAR